MSNRTSAIPLPDDEARCEPSRDCSVRSKCARAMASIGRAPLGDWTVMHGPGHALCGGFLSVSSIVKQPKPAPQNKPWPEYE